MASPLSFFSAEVGNRSFVPCSSIESLAVLRAVDAAEADTFRMGVVQNLDGVAVEDRDAGAGETREGSYGAEEAQQQ